MPEPPIATVTTYAGFIEALRARCDQLQISRSALDHVSGLQDGYSAKLLAMPQPQTSMRTLGKTSFDLLIPALGIKLALVEDEVVTSQLRSRLDVQNRDEAQVRSASIKASKNSPPGLRSVFMHAIARLGGHARARKLTAERRIAIARRAAKARWRRAAEAK
jgi:hypothetical protein